MIQSCWTCTGLSKPYTYSGPTEPKTTILFTHIPLWRPEGASCGPLREYGTIRRGVGKGYQSLLGKDTTNFLLKNLAPSVIFRSVFAFITAREITQFMIFFMNSADDHDYCRHNHKFIMENGSIAMIPEVTVKSVSMATNVHRPGFQLLTLQSGSNHLISDALCLLPDQSRIYTRGYLLSMLVTMLWLLYLNIRRSKADRDIRWCSSPSQNSPSPPNSPIHYKASYSSPVLRSATAMFPSEPPTPLGGTPLLRPPLSPYAVEDEESSEMYTLPNSPLTPGTPSKIFPRVKDNSPGKDSSYFLPSVNSHSSSQRPLWSVAQTSSTARRLTSRSVISSVFSWLWRASLNGHRKANTWYGQFGQDLLQVLFFPGIIYIIISIWYCIWLGHEFTGIFFCLEYVIITIMGRRHKNVFILTCVHKILLHLITTRPSPLIYSKRLSSDCPMSEEFFRVRWRIRQGPGRYSRFRRSSASSNFLNSQ